MSWLDKAEAEDPAYNGTGWGLGGTPGHQHSWRLVREVRQHGSLFQFFICTQPDCPAPDKSEAALARDLGLSVQRSAEPEA